MNGIEKDLEGRAEVIRLNLLSEVGRKLASRYDVQTVPTVLVLDADSKVAYRDTGTPDRREVGARITAP